MKKQFIWKGHEVKIVNTWVDDDNRKKGVTIEPVGNYGFPIDVYLDDLKKGKEEIEIAVLPYSRVPIYPFHTSFTHYNQFLFYTQVNIYNHQIRRIGYSDMRKRILLDILGAGTSL